MMRPRADVRRGPRTARHIVHGREHEDLAANIASVEIESAEHGFHLLYVNATGDGLADTWHPTLDEAKDQARFEFEIDDTAWTKVI